MNILFFILFGLVVGLIARAIMPGRQSMGIVMTAVLGIVGSFIGGLVASLLSRRSVLDFHTVGFIGSVLGALLVLIIAGRVRR